MIQAGNAEIFSAVARAQQSMAAQQAGVLPNAGVSAAPPPAQPDKPWLVTTREHLEEEAAKLKEMEDLCRKSFSRSLPYAAKLKWAEIYTRKFKETEDYSHIDVTPVLQKILMEQCSDSVKIVVLVREDILEMIDNINLEKNEKVLRSDFRRKNDGNSEKGLSSGMVSSNHYLEFARKHPYQNSYTIIFETEMTKTNLLDDISKKIDFDSITLNDPNMVVDLCPMKLNPHLVTKIADDVKFVGGLPYSSDVGKVSVIVELNLKEAEPVKAISKLDSVKKKMKKSYILIKNCEGKDYVLWINQRYDKAIKDLRNHLAFGENECSYVRANLDNFKLDIFEANLLFLMKNPFNLSKAEIFSQLLALTLLLCSDTKFLSAVKSLDEGEDDVLESYEDFFEDFSQFWQTVLQVPDNVLDVKTELLDEVDVESQTVESTVSKSEVDQLSVRQVIQKYLECLSMSIGNEACIPLDFIGAPKITDDLENKSAKPADISKFIDQSESGDNERCDAATNEIDPPKCESVVVQNAKAMEAGGFPKPALSFGQIDRDELVKHETKTARSIDPVGKDYPASKKMRTC